MKLHLSSKLQSLGVLALSTIAAAQTPATQEWVKTNYMTTFDTKSAIGMKANTSDMNDWIIKFAGYHTSDIAIQNTLMSDVAARATITDFNALKTTVSAKANASELTNLTGRVDYLTNTLVTTGNLANKVDLTTFNTFVASNNGSLTGLSNTVNTKASALDVTNLTNSVTNLTKSVSNKLETSVFSSYTTTNTTNLSALSQALSTKANTTDLALKVNASTLYDANGLLKGPKGFVGGSGITGQWMGSYVNLDTTILKFGSGPSNAGMGFSGLKFSKGYIGWGLSKDPSIVDSIRLEDFNQTTRTTYLVAGGGTVRFPTNVKMNASLAVTGSISTSGRIVSNDIHSSDVADYVFEPDYKLTSLSEVETYTKEHKHLPEVPSASEIEQGGLDLAQMNLVLLKKVEELTLHVIQQQKQIDAINKKFGGI